MKFNFIAELPTGYEYKIFQTDNDIKIIGAAHDKPPICFVIGADYKLHEIEVKP